VNEPNDHGYASQAGMNTETAIPRRGQESVPSVTVRCGKPLWRLQIRRVFQAYPLPAHMSVDLAERC